MEKGRERVSHHTAEGILSRERIRWVRGGKRGVDDGGGGDGC